jgi:hypothetical protein
MRGCATHTQESMLLICFLISLNFYSIIDLALLIHQRPNIDTHKSEVVVMCSSSYNDDIHGQAIFIGTILSYKVVTLCLILVVMSLMV